MFKELFDKNNKLKEKLTEVVISNMYKQNDQKTRNFVKQKCYEVLSTQHEKNYTVICDKINNTFDENSDKRLVVDIILQNPLLTHLQIILTSYGVHFEETFEI